jgi:hypothetical protein
MASILKVNEIQHTGGTSAMTIASNGIVNPKACVFQMYSSAVQSIPTSTETTYAWNVTTFDTNSIVDLSNNRVVITSDTAGLWFLSFTSRLKNSAPPRHINYIKVNNNVAVMFEQYSEGGAVTSGSSSCTASGLVSLSSGDVVIGRLYMDHGSSRDTETGISAARLEGYRIGTV